VSSNPFEIEAPPPGAVFTEAYTHPDNIALLEGDERARKLSRADLKKLRKKMAECEKLLLSYRYDARLALHAKIKDEFYTAKAALLGMDEQNQKPLLQHMKRCQQRAKHITQALEPARPTAAQRHRIQMRIAEHEVAVRNEKLYAELQAEMEREVRYFLEQVIRRWSALGYREEIHKDGKTRYIMPKIEEAHVTEDEIQLKVKASRITLWGSSQHFLPYQVRVQDLTKPETLAELSVACERPVTSPHNGQEFGGQDKDFSNGAWVVIHRIGMNGGLFNYVELSTVLKKYNQANRHHFPIPFGVRRGRKINYCLLDQHPHVFVDGQTFAGKTNAIVQGLCTLIQMHSPDELRIVLVDLKRGGDFNPFANVPHLITFEEEGTIIKSPEALQGVLEQMVALMYRRMAKISEITVDINKYNQRVVPDQRLARVVVVIDEYSATRMNKAAKARIDNYCVILSTQARAAGIHLIIGNQQPYANIVPQEVKGNITFKLAGRQMTQGASMTALGSGRATRIDKIPGRMVCNNGHEEFDVQIAYATEIDIAVAVRAANNYAPPDTDVWLLDDTQEYIVPESFGERLLIKTAMEHFDGALQGRPIYEFIREHHAGVTRQSVFDIIAGVTQRETVEFSGEMYKPVKYKNYFRLSPLESQNPGTQHVPIQDSTWDSGREAESDQQYPGWRTVNKTELQEEATV
jgi:S-DNA-T family DNA segregation ATPase FtsK/SpoIIIE